MRARTFWFLTLPALFVTETAGHTLVAQLLDSQDSRHRLLSKVLEDYALPFLAVAVLLAAAILGRRVLASFRAEGVQALPSWRLVWLCSSSGSPALCYTMFGYGSGCPPPRSSRRSWRTNP